MVAGVVIGGALVATADDDVVEEPRPRHWYAPAADHGLGAAYDLAAACVENDRKRTAREPFSFACFLLRDFMHAYHPGEEFVWHRSPGRAFHFAGSRRRDEQTVQEVFVRWQSFSDGLQWGFSETELTRRVGADPFRIVADTSTRDRIRHAVGPDAASQPCDVFLHRTRAVFTDQATEAVAFPAAELSAPRYGVFTAGRVRFFTPAGEPDVSP